MSENNVRAVIEALLFASEKPLTMEQIRGALDNLPAEEVHRCIEELKGEYENNNRGVRIVEIAGGFQMITPPVYASFLRKLYKQHRSDKLSNPALETLAIIAYRQPVTKLQIESIRNVNADGMMQGLLEKDLVRVAGRKKAPGRPKLYATTRRFLEHFGLRSLDELPKIEEFLASNTNKGNSNNPAKEKPNSEVSPQLTAAKEEANEPKETT